MDASDRTRWTRSAATRLGLHTAGYATWDDAEQGCHEMQLKADRPTLFAHRAPCGAYHIGHGPLRTHRYVDTR